MERIAASAWRSTAWGARQGVTHEVRRWDEGGGRLRVRVSVADIERDGPFTPMPGYRRWLAVMGAPGGLALAGPGVPGGSWRGGRGDAVALDGAGAIDARVAPRARVWNLIARDGVRWAARWVRTGDALERGGGTVIVHAPGAAARVTVGGVAYDLAPDETLVGAAGAVRADTDAIVVCAAV